MEKEKIVALIAIVLATMAVVLTTVPVMASSTTVTNPPTSCDAGWSDCANAKTDDTNYAEGTSNGQQGVWSDYGFSIPADSTIDSVKVKIKHYTADATKHSIGLEVFDGSTWNLSSHSVPASETGCFEDIIDVSGDFSWTPEKVNAIKVRLTANIGGGKPGNKWVRCCYLPVEVSYSCGSSDNECGCPCCDPVNATKFNGTIHGGIYAQTSEGEEGFCNARTMHTTFEGVPAGIKFARVYTGIWGKSPGHGGNFTIEINGESTPEHSVCDPSEPEEARCKLINNEPELHAEVTGCGAFFISYNATPYITPGTNTVNVSISESPYCADWDRIYDTALLVVYENENMPEITYWVDEGTRFVRNLPPSWTCSKINLYFDGQVYPGSVSDLKYWSFVTAPHVALQASIYPELNGKNIGKYDYVEGYPVGGYDQMYRWDTIPSDYLTTSNNHIYYYCPQAAGDVWDRIQVAVLMLNSSGASDLAVTDISPQSLYADPGETGQYANVINATVVNYGKTAHFFNLTLYANDKVIDVKRITDLGEGESKVVSFLWAPNATGPYELKVTADAEDLVNETNEANNAKTMNVEVTEASPPQWQSQSTNDTDNQIPNGGTIELRAQGSAEIGLDSAILATDETGTWLNCTGYGSPLDMASYLSDSVVHTSEADWNAQTIDTFVEDGVIKQNLAVSGGDVELYQMTGIENIAFQKDTENSTWMAGHPSKNANDGDIETEWKSNNELPCWWKVDLESVTDVRKVYIDFGPWCGEQHFAIFISDDGENWTCKKEMGYHSSRTVTLDNLDWSCQYINVTIYENFAGFAFGAIAEFEAYGLGDYRLSGNLTSSAIETDNPIVAVTPEWNSTKPAGTSLAVSVSVDNGATWKSAVNGGELTWDYDVYNTSLKYKVLFETTDVTQTPVLHDITLNHKTRDPVESEWLWSNFTWHNPSITDRTVNWKIYYEDMLGKTNCTDIMSFDVGTPAPDTTGPITSNVAANPNPTNGANTVTLTATIDDSTTGNSVITAAEYFVDTVGSNGTGTAMSASDGAFDTATEAVTADIDVSGWAVGIYTLYVHGMDAANNWGATSAVVLEVTETPSNVMHVYSIDMWSTKAGPNYKIYTEVKIVDSSNEGVPYATVYINTTLPGGNNVSDFGDTLDDGTVQFKYGPTKTLGTYTSTVTDVEKTGWEYDSGANVETSDSITI